MREFCLKIIGFFLLLLFLVCLLDIIISTGLRQTEDYRFQSWTDIVDSKINADVLIMGNSRAFSHYSTGIIDSVLNVNSYNLGIGGHPFNVQYLKYKLYEKYNVKPKLIVQNIDFSTLNSSKIGHEREQLFPFVFDGLLNHYLVNFGYNRLELTLPLYRYFGYQMVIKNGMFEYFGIKHYNLQPSYKGYRPEQGKWDGSELEKLSIIKPSMDQTTIRLFDEYLLYCKKNNIKVVFVNTPVYYKATRKLANKVKFNSLIYSFSKKYNIPYMDYTNDSLCYDTSYFTVAVHLNKKGAELFSLKLSNDLKKMGY